MTKKGVKKKYKKWSFLGAKKCQKTVPKGAKMVKKGVKNDPFLTKMSDLSYCSVRDFVFFKKITFLKTGFFKNDIFVIF